MLRLVPTFRAPSPTWVARLLLLLAALLVATLPGAGPKAGEPREGEREAARAPDDAGAPGAPSEQVALDLRVTAADGPAIAGARARVFARGTDGRYHAAGEALTDGDGAAAVQGLPAGEAWIVVDAAGRARGGAHVVLAAPARSVDVALAPARALDVEVVDEDGRPVEGATVEVRGASAVPASASTGPDGHAAVPGVAAGAGVVVARARAFDETSRRFAADAATVRVVLGRLGALVVRVLDARGGPAAGAEVALASAVLFPARVARADAHGAARIGALPPGTYALRASRGGEVSATEVGVVVERGATREFELRLVAGRFVLVAVRSDDGAVDGARVLLVEGGVSPFPVEATTGRNGSARLGPVPNGDPAAVSVRAEGLVARGPLAVPEGPSPRLDVVLERAVALHGRVVDGRGFPVAGARLHVLGTDREGMPVDEEPGRVAFRDAHFARALAGPGALVPAGDLGVVPGPVPPVPRLGGPVGAPGTSAGAVAAAPWLSGRDGTFTIEGLPPGRLRVAAQHALYVDTESEAVEVVPAARGGAPATANDVTIVMREGGALVGRVVDRRGRGVEGADVTVLATRGDLERRVVTAGDGTFELAAMPGEVTVFVARPEDPSRPVFRATFDVPDRGRREVTLELPEARGPTKVVVRDERGEPVEGAEVRVVSLVAAEPVRATHFTGRRGDVEVSEVRGLAALVEVAAPGFASRQVTAASLGPELPIALPRAARLVGVVRARAGALGGAEVAWDGEGGVRRTRTAPDGSFQLGDLAPGQGRLDVWARGHAPAARALALRAGERPTDVGPVDLDAEATVEGTVVDARGAPVAGARVAAGRVGTFAPAAAVVDRAATTDARGAFRLGELAEGEVALEAFSPLAGRGRVEGVRVVRGRTTGGVRVALAAGDAAPSDPRGQASVAVTLAESGDPVEVSLADVAPGSEAERAGLRVGDVVLDVSGAAAANLEATRRALTGPLVDDVLVRIRRGDAVRTVRVRRELVRR